ncbi:MAG: hypothetical protein ACUVX1_15710 [Chloroflexota bacterium]
MTWEAVLVGVVALLVGLLLGRAGKSTRSVQDELNQTRITMSYVLEVGRLRSEVVAQRCLERQVHRLLNLVTMMISRPLSLDEVTSLSGACLGVRQELAAIANVREGLGTTDGSGLSPLSRGPKQEPSSLGGQDSSGWL